MKAELSPCVGNGSGDVAIKAQQLLEHSLLSELRAVVARALSGLEMFAGNQLTELDLLGAESYEKDIPELKRVWPLARVLHPLTPKSHLVWHSCLPIRFPSAGNICYLTCP